MNEDDGIPDWARPLVRGPINVDETTTFDGMSDEFRERLEALLQLYQCDATPAGWRTLALRLALEHEIEGTPALRVVVPGDRDPKTGGAEPGDVWWLGKRLLKKSAEIGSIKAAAKQIARKTGHSVGRLQNLATDMKAGRISKPRAMQRWRWNDWIDAALDDAADRLENGHDPGHMAS